MDWFELFYSNLPEKKCSIFVNRSSIGDGLCIIGVEEEVFEKGWDEVVEEPGYLVLPDSVDGEPIVEIGKNALNDRGISEESAYRTEFRLFSKAVYLMVAS